MLHAGRVVVDTACRCVRSGQSVLAALLSFIVIKLSEQARLISARCTKVMPSAFWLHAMDDIGIFYLLMGPTGEAEAMVDPDDGTVVVQDDLDQLLTVRGKGFLNVSNLYLC